MKKSSIVFLVCLFCLECGYHFRGTGSFLPPHIKKVNVPMFKNLTARFELDLKLTRSIIDELVARGKIEVSSDMKGADAVLLGEIVSFNVNPIGFTNKAIADKYNIIVVAKINLRDLINRKVIYSNPRFVFQEEYEVPEGVDFETVEAQALDRIAEKFARSVVVTLLEGF